MRSNISPQYFSDIPSMSGLIEMKLHVFCPSGGRDNGGSGGIGNEVTSYSGVPILQQWDLCSGDSSQLHSCK